MNHCVGKTLLALLAMLPVLFVGGCDSSGTPAVTGGTGGASHATGGTTETVTGATNPATGGTTYILTDSSALGTAGTTGNTSAPETGGTAAGGGPGGASSEGGIGAGGVSTSGGVTTSGGAIASGGVTASAGATGRGPGGTVAGGRSGSGGAAGGAGGASASGGGTTSGGAIASGGVTASGGAAGRGAGGSSAGGRGGAGGTTPTGGATPTGGSTPTGGATPTGGTTGAGSTGTAPSGTPVSVHGQLSVKGNKIVDQNGNPVTLHGMSMYAWSQQGTQFYNASAVGHLAKDLDCAVLRIPILPNDLSSQTTLVKTVVEACIANGIYAIIDWHGGGTSQTTAAASFFASMATAYGNTPNVMYEPWNEPTVAWATVKTYHEAIIAAIRPIDPDNIIILGTPQWDQLPQDAAADPVTTTTNLAYTVHFYANSHPLAGFEPGINTALKAGLAIFVTEYGGCSANGSGTFNAAALQLWWNFLDANDIGCTNWAVETNGETSSIFKPSASATGPWTTADLTSPDGTTIISYIQSKYAATLTSP
ncbi:MAG: glycoside hydrolase family 5 protein [Polyangia bacterium]